ncbi:hypothetical protein C8Q76DRAFT_737135 [Earliella scabrosa]|nr:hypothetical protein C8Q76DRAFT_737135 [Earliella scabrosa]
MIFCFIFLLYILLLCSPHCRTRDRIALYFSVLGPYRVLTYRTAVVATSVYTVSLAYPNVHDRLSVCCHRVHRVHRGCLSPA